jgi:hypothetical protein
MKNLGLYSLLFLMSACGKVEFGTNLESSIGSLRPSGETKKMSSLELTRLTSICQAIARKTSLLNVQTPTDVFNFDVSGTDCEGKSTLSQVVSTKVQKENSQFIFKPVTEGESVPFNFLETSQSGQFATICQNLTSLTEMPVDKGNGEVMYLSTLETSDCPLRTNELCVLMESASKTSNGNFYQVHTSEWLRVYTNPDLKNANSRFYGFITDRKSATSGFCTSNKAQSKRQTLKI